MYTKYALVKLVEETVQRAEGSPDQQFPLLHTPVVSVVNSPYISFHQPPNQGLENCFRLCYDGQIFLVGSNARADTMCLAREIARDVLYRMGKRWMKSILHLPDEEEYYFEAYQTPSGDQ